MAHSSPSETKKSISNTKPLTSAEIAEFSNQMALMLHSGISSLEALEILLEDAKNTDEKELLSQILTELETCGQLYIAIESTHLFPPYMVHMIRLGEETGTLDDIMYGLSSHYTHEDTIAHLIRSAFVYPAIMLSMMVLIILVLLTKVMPVFQQVFTQLGQEMTGFSAVLLDMGQALSNYTSIIVILIAVTGFLLYRLWNKLPFHKRLEEEIAICHFADGISIALKSGFSIEQSIDLTRSLIESSSVLEKIHFCESEYNNHNIFSKALHDSGIFSGSHARRIRIAEKSGQMDEALSQIAEEYTYAIQSKISQWISMIEPTLVIILSIVVGTLLFSVMLPLLGIMTGL